MMKTLDNVVTLKDGRRGKVIGQAESGEYILMSESSGRISYFKKCEISE